MEAKEFDTKNKKEIALKRERKGANENKGGCKSVIIQWNETDLPVLILEQARVDVLITLIGEFQQLIKWFVKRLFGSVIYVLFSQSNNTFVLSLKKRTSQILLLT